MDPIEFIRKYTNAQLSYPKGCYSGECLSLAKVYIEEMYDIKAPVSDGSAFGYWRNFPDPLGSVFDKILSTPGNDPQLGDIVIWHRTNALPYGHIAIIVACGPLWFVSFDQNWLGHKRAQLVMHDYVDVAGWLRCKPNGTEGERKEA